MQSCIHNPSAPDKPVAFSSSDLPNNVTMLPNVGRLNEFDMTVVYPDRPAQSLMTDEIQQVLRKKLAKVLPPPSIEGH